MIVVHTYVHRGRRYAVIYAFARNPKAEAQVAMWQMRQDAPIPEVELVRTGSINNVYREV